MSFPSPGAGANRDVTIVYLRVRKSVSLSGPGQAMDEDRGSMTYILDTQAWSAGSQVPVSIFRSGLEML